MILAVNMNPSAATRQGIGGVMRGLKRAGAERVVERHYRRVDVDRLNPAGIVLGPQGVPFDAYPDLERMLDFVRTLDRPTLAICGGFQALILAYGGTLAPLFGGEAQGEYRNLKKEVGPRLVAIEAPGDPLFGGLPPVQSYVVSHFEGTDTLPDSLSLLGRGDPCPVQAIRVTGRPCWGVQFHPEKGEDGHELLRRFVALCRLSKGAPSDA